MNECNIFIYNKCISILMCQEFDIVNPIYQSVAKLLL